MWLHRPPVVFPAFVAINVLLAVWRLWSASSLSWGSSAPTNQVYHSYVSGDYPMYFAVPPMGPVAMSLHETSHYWMDPNDTISDKEWGTTLLYTPGYGRVRLGPEHRVFVVSYFHQLHCLRGIQGGIVFPGRDEEVRGTYEHVQHCLNYLRQTFLCTAADMLEKGDFMENSFEPGTLGDDLVCQDWEVLLRAMRDNYDEFVEWNQKWN